MTDKDVVTESVAQILRKNGFANSDRLRQRDFDLVSQEIQSVTGILISGATIKRLLNGDFARLPQIATLDAIGKYLGYKNWQEYKSRNADGDYKTAVPVGNPLGTETKKSRRPVLRLKASTIVYLLVGISVIAILSFRQFTTTKDISNFDKAIFTAKKNEVKQIPNTVVFTYNIDDLEADSFFIQQSWDRNRRVQVFKNNYTLTDIYYEPGYHIAKLIANDSVIKAVEVMIPTDGWFVFAKDVAPGSLPEYIAGAKNSDEGLFQVKEENLAESKIDITKEKVYSYTYFLDSMEASSDNFILKTRVRMKEIKSNFCPYVALEVFTQRYFFVQKITTQGCASEAQLQFGERSVNGKENDLVLLGHDVRQWADIEWVVKNRKVNIKLNGKDVFSTAYKTDSRMITGLAFMSNGLCEVDFVDLKTIDGTVIYHDEFDSQNK